MLLSESMLSAAHQLVGKKLGSGWNVVKKVDNGQSTGGFFSVCYLVEKSGKIGFLKVIDFMAFLQMNSESDFMAAMNDMLSAYVYERDLLSLCRDRRFNNIPILYDDGIEQVKMFPFKIPYLIFELAEGSVRKYIVDFNNNVNRAWMLKSLHNVALGIRQLHTAEITHQDIKPSNVFVFDQNISKLGDLGRSIGKKSSNKASHTEYLFAGQTHYAPPEIMYGYIIPDWHKRVFATDMYLFGSLIAFYFTGMHFNTVLYEKLDDQFNFHNWVQSNRTFEQVKEHLVEAFRMAMGEIKSILSVNPINEEIIRLIQKLCYPVPENRGLHTFLGSSRNPYDFQAVISKLDYLRRKAELDAISSVNIRL